MQQVERAAVLPLQSFIKASHTLYLHVLVRARAPQTRHNVADVVHSAAADVMRLLVAASPASLVLQRHTMARFSFLGCILPRGAVIIA